MNARSVWMLIVLATLTYGSLLAVGGYAAYLRSDAYRIYCAEQLSQTLELPSEIGRVTPRSWLSREFNDITVWLPDRRDQVFACRRAVLRYLQSDSDDYELLLVGGTCEISTRTWLRADYRGVFESGARSGLRAAGPRRVSFREMDVTFERDDFVLRLQDARGQVTFDEHDRGKARISCPTLNGHTTLEPVLLEVEFSAAAQGVRIDRLVLTVPSTPVAQLGVGLLVGSNIVSGTFAGALEYRETPDGPVARCAGRCTDLQLAELTAGLFATPWQGHCPEIELQELVLADGRPQRLAFRGMLRNVQLNDILAAGGLPSGGGIARLAVDRAEFSSRGIDTLVASGACTDFSLEQFTSQLGLGDMTGLLNVTIDDLSIAGNRLSALEARLHVPPAQEEDENWIEARLLKELARRFLNVDIDAAVPSWIPLPERIAYAELGVRLSVADEQLIVHGTHGQGERTILTARLMGYDIPLIHEPRMSFNLTPWLDSVRERMRLLMQQRLGIEPPAPPPPPATPE